jgi:predicted amidohydrolase
VRVAIAQTAMTWSVEESTDAVLAGLDAAAALGAELAVVPECAATGYHRRLPDRVDDLTLAASLARIRERCAALGLPAVVGTPHPAPNAPGRYLDAAVAIDGSGAVVAVTAKTGLTASEVRYFVPGGAREVFALGGTRCAVLLCREARDAERLRCEVAGARLVLWPSVIAWDYDGPVREEDRVGEEGAAHCARTLGAWIVQANAPASLNRPELRGFGGSLVLSPRGDIVHRSALDRATIEVVEIPVED